MKTTTEEIVMCRATEMLGGHEFICVLKQHGDPVDKNGRAMPWENARGAPSKWRRHFFRRRYPMSDH